VAWWGGFGEGKGEEAARVGGGALRGGEEARGGGAGVREASATGRREAAGGWGRT
jgi:hypothetical protein